MLQGLSESDNIKIHWQIDLFHRIPEAQGFTGWLLKPLAHHLIENTSEGFWPLANMKSKYSDPPHFTLDHNSPVLDNVKFIKVRCKMIKLQSIANLSACLENNAYYVPEDPNSNSPLFDAFTVELDHVKKSATFWILQITTSQRHGGSAIGYQRICEIIAILKARF